MNEAWVKPLSRVRGCLGFGQPETLPGKAPAIIVCNVPNKLFMYHSEKRRVTFNITAPSGRVISLKLPLKPTNAGYHDVYIDFRVLPEGNYESTERKLVNMMNSREAPLVRITSHNYATSLPRYSRNNATMNLTHEEEAFVEEIARRAKVRERSGIESENRQSHVKQGGRTAHGRKL